MRRSFTRPGTSAAITQRVVRYQPGRGSAVVDLFRRTLASCPVRSAPATATGRWEVLTDTTSAATDTLVIRRTLPGSHPAWVEHRVVVRQGDVVSVLRYAPATRTGDDAGARALAGATATRMRTPG